jgi:TolB protein
MSIDIRNLPRQLLPVAAGALVAGLLTFVSAPASSGAPTPSSPRAEQRGTFPGANGILTFCRINPYGGDLVAMRLDGTHRRVLVRSPGNLLSVFSDWSPDGRRLVFDRERADGNIDIFLRRPGGKIVRLTEHEARDAHPMWAPGGERIVFESDRSGRPQLYTMRKDGTHLRQVTHLPAGAEEPAWAPRGNRIAFLSGPVRRTALFLIRPDGSDLTRLTARRLNATHPSWSPNGRWIVFNHHFETRNSRIFVIRANGEGQRQLTKAPNGVEDFEPAFSPDGRLIAFSSFGRGRHEDADIWVMRTDGTHLRNVTPRARGFEIGVTWRPRRDLP